MLRRRGRRKERRRRRPSPSEGGRRKWKHIFLPAPALLFLIPYVLLCVWCVKPRPGFFFGGGGHRERRSTNNSTKYRRSAHNGRAVGGGLLPELPATQTTIYCESCNLWYNAGSGRGYRRSPPICHIMPAEVQAPTSGLLPYTHVFTL